MRISQSGCGIIRKFAHVASAKRTKTLSAAPPLLNTPEIPESQYAGSIEQTIGMPPPKSGVMRQTDDAYLRRSYWGKNIYFDEPITQMVPNRHLSWGYRFYPDSFPPGAMDEHVVIGGEYFDLIDTDFTLTQLPGARTKVQIRIGFRVSTGFNFYAVPAAKLVLGNFTETALGYFGSNASTTDQIANSD